MKDNYAEDEESPRRLCQVHQRLLRQVRARQAVSAGREHGRGHAAESHMIQGMHFRNFTQKSSSRAIRRKSSGTWRPRGFRAPTATHRSFTCPVSSWA
ncbi:Uncharacterized protein FKW44_018861 [Caligus rogercresseyi]|uniref:Uncharacterized protein n=1 Tax=Caligus rogercresseyi TaxID=217165 RepID=A0A7T8GUZ8_CALRO|nr:Uncharacterized protein FKW44_018861 [Caligus rogercresseyi]